MQRLLDDLEVLRAEERHPAIDNMLRLAATGYYSRATALTRSPGDALVLHLEMLQRELRGGQARLICDRMKRAVEVGKYLE